MSNLEKNLQEISWLFQKLWLFIRPVWFQIVMVLTVLYGVQVFVAYGWYREGGFGFAVFLKAIFFLLKNKSEAIVAGFCVMWLSHWFYFWKKLKSEVIYQTEISGNVLNGTVLCFGFLVLCLFDSQRASPWMDPRFIKEFIFPAAQVFMGFVFPIVLLGNVWLWLVEKYSAASNKVYGTIRLKELEEKYAQSEQNRPREAVPLQVNIQAPKRNMEIERPLL